jgi:hypothetical protein
MPVLGEHNVPEAARELIDERHDLIARRDGKASTGTEIILNIDYDQDVTIGHFTRHAAVPSIRSIPVRPSCGLHNHQA